MSNLREAVARAIHKAAVGETADLEQWREWLDDADAALSAARPQIEAQTREAAAKVAEADANNVAGHRIAAAIRNQEPSK